LTGGFTSGAIGNLDADASLDIWVVDDVRNLRNVSDDVTV
jgi:hypothetical protein